MNGARGTREIEGKATRVGASELGRERVSKPNSFLSSLNCSTFSLLTRHREPVTRTSFGSAIRRDTCFGRDEDGFELWIVADAIQIGIDFGVINETGAAH